MTSLTTTSAIPEARVLVVDDETHVRSALARSLTLTGFSADEAASGHHALEMLERAPYDAMVLDIRMPGIDGVEVMSRACQLYPDLCIIILTGHATLESAIAAVKSHAADYLLKPASVHDIAAAIDCALQQRVQKEQAQTPVLGRFPCAGPVTLDQERQLAIVATGDAGGLMVKLTASESALLAQMIQHPNTTFSCRELTQTALGYNVSEQEARGIIRPHIFRLRKKIEPDPDRPRLIRTAPGKGYLFAP
jgi:DNA-binding response OmpR family regulator